jgi:hypothetical protein
MAEISKRLKEIAEEIAKEMNNQRPETTKHHFSTMSPNQKQETFKLLCETLNKSPRAEVAKQLIDTMNKKDDEKMLKEITKIKQDIKTAKIIIFLAPILFIIGIILISLNQ